MDTHDRLASAITCVRACQRSLGIVRGSVANAFGIRHAHSDTAIRASEELLGYALDNLWEAQLAAAAAPVGEA
jgi:hypothetical protein